MSEVKREEYVARKHGLSPSNEPADDLIITCNTRLYPDMYYGYQRFSKIFDLPLNRFFLGNGCENTMKNVLLAIKPKSLGWSTPTWRLPEVYCAAQQIKPINKQYVCVPLSEGRFAVVEPDWHDQHADVFYSCCGVTSCFPYFSDHVFGINRSRYNILDVSYLTIEQIKDIIKKVYNSENSIIVGSFDKLFGCGLRLGFAIYPEKLNDAMQLQREQFINCAAFEFLTNHPVRTPASKYYLQLQKMLKQDSLTRNFIVLPGHIQCNLNAHYFQLRQRDTDKMQDFTRLGIPSTQEEFDAVKLLINSLKDNIDE